MSSTESAKKKQKTTHSQEKEEEGKVGEVSSENKDADSDEKDNLLALEEAVNVLFEEIMGEMMGIHELQQRVLELCREVVADYKKKKVEAAVSKVEAMVGRVKDQRKCNGQVHEEVDCLDDEEVQCEMNSWDELVNMLQNCLNQMKVQPRRTGFVNWRAQWRIRSDAEDFY
eukprot:gene563-611_t